jgi:hypothetical protein
MLSQLCNTFQLLRLPQKTARAYNHSEVTVPSLDASEHQADDEITVLLEAGKLSSAATKQFPRLEK